jgi:hypothetical protein
VRCPSCQTTFTAEAPSQVGGVTTGQASGQVRTSPAKRSPEPEEPAPDEDYETPSRSRRRRPRDDDDDTPRRPHRGALVLTLGIISLVMPVLAGGTFCLCGGFGLVGFGVAGLATGLPAWFLGQGDLKAMSMREMDRSGEGMTRGGWICAIIGTILGALQLLCGGVLLILFFVALATGNVK